MSLRLRQAIVWMLLYTYSIYVLFPLRLRYCCLLAFVLAAMHTLLVGLAPRQPTDHLFSEQVRIEIAIRACVCSRRQIECTLMLLYNCITMPARNARLADLIDVFLIFIRLH